MKPTRSSVLLFAVCVPLLLGQSTRSSAPRAGTSAPSTVTATSGSGDVTISRSDGIFSSGNIITTGGTVSSGWITGVTVSDGGWNRNAVPLETRKLKTPLPTIADVKLSAKLVSNSELAPAQYLKLAKAVSLESAATDEAQVLDAIHIHGFKLFDYDRVDDFLYNQALHMKANTRWVWKPAREKDLKAVNDSGTATWSTQSGMGFVYPQAYAQKVPARILEDMACLIAEIPDAIFLVSDFAVIKPDPFIAVTTPRLLKENRIFIFGQWGEPTFDDGLKPVSIARR